MYKEFLQIDEEIKEWQQVGIHNLRKRILGGKNKTWRWAVEIIGSVLYKWKHEYIREHGQVTYCSVAGNSESADNLSMVYPCCGIKWLLNEFRL